MILFLRQINERSSSYDQYDPLSTSNKLNHQESPIQVSEYDTFIKLKSLNSNKSSGPDKIAPWFLKY